MYRVLTWFIGPGGGPAGGPGGPGGGDPMGGLGSMFKDPNMIQKLASNPKTSSFLSDPVFMSKLQGMQQGSGNPAELLGDPRMITVLGVLMGVDMELRESAPDAQDSPMPDAPAPEPRQPERATEVPESERVQEVEEVDEEALEKKKAKEEADKEKALGTENYKKRNFDEAIAHYSKAWELFKDITYLNNLGAAYFEKGDYDKCIESCTKAIEEGREIYADFKIIAKSYARIGTAYERKGDLTLAIEHYNKSLTEHRTPEVLNKLRAAERTKLETDRAAYVDPVKADEAREEGNKKFKETDFPGAVASYTEMIKRAPADPRGYSNRAAAFIKLFEFPSAVDDCNAAIKKDPTFIRAYIRKAQAYFGMRKYSECVDACDEAHVVDQEHHNNANTREIESQQSKALSAMYSARDNETEDETRDRLMKDPEVSERLTVTRGLLTFLDYEHHARSRHAVHPAAGSVQPGGSPGAHAQPPGPIQGAEAHRGRSDPSRKVNRGTLGFQGRREKAEGSLHGKLGTEGIERF